MKNIFELRQVLLDRIEINRDLLERVRRFEPGCEESDEMIRGRSAEDRDLLAIIDDILEEEKKNDA